MTDKPPFLKIRLAPAEVGVEKLRGGGMILRSPQPLATYEKHLGEMLRRQAGLRPEQTFLAERQGESWRRLSWAEGLQAAESVGQALAERRLGADRPVMILSGNSVDHALLMLGAHLAGVPVAPVSPAYSLLSQDFGKLRQVAEQVRPGMIFVDTPEPFAKALGCLDLLDVEIVVGRRRQDGAGDAGGSGGAGGDVTSFSELLANKPGDALRRAEALVGPDTVAKVLFTSGSTGTPKGVINTHRMLCSNQQMIAQLWPFLTEEPLVLVDWLPWNHTFGGNHNFNMILKHGGTLYIDGGKPRPDLVGETVRNLRQTFPTLYFNVPAGFAQLLPHLEEDQELCRNFFRRLKLVFYAGAALPQDLWERLEKLSIQTLGQRVFMTSAWGSTETSPLATSVHFPIERAGVIGLPAPGVEIKLLPEGSRMELRVRGPHVTPGYLHDPELTAAAFDEEGFYKIGDAGHLVDLERPERGLVFDGRVAENFKLQSGTWVHVGEVRVAALAAAAPALADAVVTGHDRAFVGLLAWPNLVACQRLCGLADQEGQEGDILRRSEVLSCVREGIERFNATQRGTSTRIARVLLLAEPPSLDEGEITDKGYINQRATLERRAALVERLYGEDPLPEEVILLPSSSA